MSRSYSRLAVLMVLAAFAGSLHAGERGVRIDPPRTIGTFSLVDQNNQAVSFPLADAGWQLVAFGYTHCPDVCPMTLHKTTQLLAALGRDSGRVRVVFISIDSARDSVQAMKEFVGRFDSRILGLTGDVETLQATANAFEVLTRRFQGKTALAYTLEHSSFLYLLDPQGRMRMLYPGTADIDLMVADFRRLWRNPSARNR